jgi:hypothetical protein
MDSAFLSSFLNSSIIEIIITSRILEALALKNLSHSGF